MSRKIETIFAPDNPYRYRLNVAHSAIVPIYEWFRRYVGAPGVGPVSDQERKEFEGAVMRLLEAGAFARSLQAAERERERMEKEAQKKDAVRMVGSPLHSVRNENII